MKGGNHASWFELPLVELLEDVVERAQGVVGKDLDTEFVQSDVEELDFASKYTCFTSETPSWKMLEVSTHQHMRLISAFAASGDDEQLRSLLVVVARHLKAKINHSASVKSKRKSASKRTKKETAVSPLTTLSVRSALHVLFAFLRHAKRGEGGSELLLDLMSGLAVIMGELPALSLYDNAPTTFENARLEEVLAFLEQCIPVECSDTLWEETVSFLCALCRQLGTVTSIFSFTRVLQEKGPQRSIPLILCQPLFKTCQTLYQEKAEFADQLSGLADDEEIKHSCPLDSYILAETGEENDRTITGEDLSSLLISYAGEMANFTMTIPVTGKSKASHPSGDVKVLGYCSNNYNETPLVGSSHTMMLPETTIVDVQAGSNCNFILDSDGVIMSIGKGDYGRLGIGNTANQTTWNSLSFGSYTVTKFTVSPGSYGHGLAIDNENSLWSWGDGDYGKLGHGNTDRLETPQPIASLAGIEFEEIACGNAHSIALTVDGQVWGWGGNASGSSTSDNSTPTHLIELDDEGITQIAAGCTHSVALGRQGQVVWGWGQNMITGLSTDNTSTPLRIEGLCDLNIKQLACGDNFTMALTRTGQVYLLGTVDVDGMPPYHQPTLVAGLEDETVVYIAAGGNRLFALTDNHQCYRWGDLEGELRVSTPTLFLGEDDFEWSQISISAECVLFSNIPRDESSVSAPVPLPRSPFAVDMESSKPLVSRMRSFHSRIQVQGEEETTLTDEEHHQLERLMQLVRANFYHGMQMGAEFTKEQIDTLRTFLFSLLERKDLTTGVSSACRDIFEESWDVLFTTLQDQVEVLKKILPKDDTTWSSFNQTDGFLLTVSSDALTKDNRLAQHYYIPCDLKNISVESFVPEDQENPLAPVEELVMQLISFCEYCTLQIHREEGVGKVDDVPSLLRAASQMLEYFVTRILAVCVDEATSHERWDRLAVRIVKDIIRSVMQIPSSAKELGLLESLLPYSLLSLHFSSQVTKELFNDIKGLLMVLPQWEQCPSNSRVSLVCTSLLGQRFNSFLGGQTTAYSEAMEELQKGKLFEKGFSLSYMPTSALGLELLHGNAMKSDAFRCIEQFARETLLLPSEEQYLQLQHVVASYIALSCRVLGMEKKLERLDRRGSKALDPILRHIITEAYIFRDSLLRKFNESMERLGDDDDEAEPRTLEQKEEQVMSNLTQPICNAAEFYYVHVPPTQDSSEIQFLDQLPTPTLRASISNIDRDSPRSHSALRFSSPFESQQITRSPRQKKKNQQQSASPKTVVDQATLRLQQMQPIRREDEETKRERSLILQEIKERLQIPQEKIDLVKVICEDQNTLSAPICSAVKELTALVNELQSQPCILGSMLASALDLVLPSNQSKWTSSIIDEDIVTALQDLVAQLVPLFDRVEGEGDDALALRISLLRILSAIFYRASLPPPLNYVRALCRLFIQGNREQTNLHLYPFFSIILGCLPREVEETHLQDICDEIQDMLRELVDNKRLVSWLVTILFTNLARTSLHAILSEPSWIELFMQILDNPYIPDIGQALNCLHCILPTISDDTEAWKSMHSITNRLFQFIEDRSFEWYSTPLTDVATNLFHLSISSDTPRFFRDGMTYVATIRDTPLAEGEGFFKLIPIDEDRSEGASLASVWCTIQLNLIDEEPTGEPLDICWAYIYENDTNALILPPLREGEQDGNENGPEEELLMRLLGINNSEFLPYGQPCILSLSNVRARTEHTAQAEVYPAVGNIQLAVNLLQSLHNTPWKTFIDSRIKNTLVPTNGAATPQSLACMRLISGFYSGLVPGSTARLSSNEVVTVQDTPLDTTYDCLFHGDNPHFEEVVTRPVPIFPPKSAYPVSPEILQYLLEQIDCEGTLYSWEVGLTSIHAIKSLHRYLEQDPTTVKSMLYSLFSNRGLEARLLDMARRPNEFTKDWERVEEIIFFLIGSLKERLIQGDTSEEDEEDYGSLELFFKLNYPSAWPIEEIRERIMKQEISVTPFKNEEAPRLLFTAPDCFTRARALGTDVNLLSLKRAIALFQLVHMGALARKCFLELLPEWKYTKESLIDVPQAMQMALLQCSYTPSRYLTSDGMRTLFAAFVEHNGEDGTQSLMNRTILLMHKALTDRLLDPPVHEINMKNLTTWIDNVLPILSEEQQNTLSSHVMDFYASGVCASSFSCWDRGICASQIAKKLYPLWLAGAEELKKVESSLNTPMGSHMLKHLNDFIQKQYTAESRTTQQGVHSYMLRSLAVLHVILEGIMVPADSQDAKQSSVLDTFVCAVLTTNSFQQKTPVPLVMAAKVIKDFVPPAEGEPLPSYFDNERWTSERDEKLLEWNRTRPTDWKDPQMMWVWGDGREGQLASAGNCLAPELSKEFCALAPKQIAGGIDFTLVLTTEGQVYSTGKGDYGRLGLGDTTSRRELNKLTFPNNATIVKVNSSRGSYGASIAQDEEGRLYVWGDGDYGKLGLGHTSLTSRPEELVSMRDERVVSFSCGYMHSGVVTGDGEVYVWGEGQRLGLDIYENKDRPQLLEGLAGVHAEYISCGEYHTLVIANQGTEVWSWGHENEHGQLGLGHTSREGTPKQVSFDQQYRFVKAEASSSFSVLLTSSGKVLTCGRGDQGALGQMDITDNYVFAEVQGLPHIVDISAGMNFTLALSSTGQVFAWGANEFGELGSGDTIATYVPEEIPLFRTIDIPITHIAAGSTSCYCVAELSDPSQLLPKTIPPGYEILADVHDNDMFGRLCLLNGYSQMVFRAQPLLSFTPALLPTFGMEDNVWRLKYEAKISCLRQYIQNTVPESQDHGPEIQLNRFISENRRSLFLQACEQLMKERPSAMFPARAWRVTLLGEGSIDAGGPYNESVTQIAGELHRGRVSIVQPTPNRLYSTGDYQDGIMPVPVGSDCTKDQQTQLRFLGRLMGIAVRSSAPISLQFPLIFWKLLMGANVTAADLRTYDAAFVERHEYLLRLEQIGITEDLFADLPLEKFVPVPTSDNTGEFITLTFANRQAYAEAAFDSQLRQWDTAMEWIGKGMDDMIPRSVMRLFSPKEVDTLVCGEATFNWELLKSSASYENNYQHNSSPVQLLWDVLENDFNNEQSGMFLRFVWGRSRLPLLSSQLSQSLCIRKVPGGDNALPSSATCFFRLYLPEYSSRAILKEKLLYAIEHCVSIDTDNQAQPVEMAID